MSHYVLEFGGGLGDMLYQCYQEGAYNVLRDLEPDDTADVNLVVHNPAAPELFEWHPKRSQMRVQYHGYWSPANDEYERRIRNLPPPGSNYALPSKDRQLTFYPSPADLLLLQSLAPKGYIVFAASAGTPDRIMPDVLQLRIIHRLLERTELPIVFVGRTYERDGRWEPVPIDHPRLHNLVDKLSLPGTCHLVQQAAGLVTTHSSLNLLGWCENRPQLLVYPQNVLDRHVHQGLYDQWLFGANRPTTTHGLFEHFDEAWVDQFITHLDLT